jgi:hypothetical protein
VLLEFGHITLAMPDGGNSMVSRSVEQWRERTLRGGCIGPRGSRGRVCGGVYGGGNVSVNGVNVVFLGKFCILFCNGIRRLRAGVAELSG